MYGCLFETVWLPQPQCQDPASQFVCICIRLHSELAGAVLNERRMFTSASAWVMSKAIFLHFNLHLAGWWWWVVLPPLCSCCCCSTQYNVFASHSTPFVLFCVIVYLFVYLLLVSPRGTDWNVEILLPLSYHQQRIVITSKREHILHSMSIAIHPTTNPKCLCQTSSRQRSSRQ